MNIRLIDKISGKMLYVISQIVGATCKYEVSGKEYMVEAFKSGRPVIVTGWHGMTIMVVPFIIAMHDITTFVVIMPDDWRGASLKVFTESLGATPFPMNLHGDSSLGMGRKLVKLVREVVNGKHLFLNPDGPEGPSFVIKPGMTFIAKKSNALIMPIGAYVRNGYVVPRWDRYTIPYPFSRVSICVGEPIEVPSDTDDFTEITENITNEIHRVTMQAAANYYEKKN